MRPSLCSCQCIAVERGPSTCSRYMPTLRLPSRGSRVITAGSVMNGPPSPGPAGLHRSSDRSTSSPRSTTSWQAPLRTLFGRESAIDLSCLQALDLRASPSGGCISRMSPTRSPTSSSDSTPNARHMRRSVPNWLMSSGTLASLRALEEQRRAAGLDERSTISVTSRCGSTSAATRTSSPSRSRSAIHSRRSPTERHQCGESRQARAAAGGRRGGGPPTSSARRARSPTGRSGRRQHPEDDVGALAGGVEDHAATLAECSASARATASSLGDAAEGARRVDPRRPVVRPPVGPLRGAARDQLGERGDRGTPPASAIRTSPCA